MDVVMAYLLEKEEVCPSTPENSKEYDHGDLHPFLSRELWK